MASNFEEPMTEENDASQEVGENPQAEPTTPEGDELGAVGGAGVGDGDHDGDYDEYRDVDSDSEYTDQESSESETEEDSDESWTTILAEMGCKPVRQIKSLKFLYPEIHVTGGEGSMTSIYKCAFKNVIVSIQGQESSFFLEKSSWDNATLIFRGNENTFLFNHCEFKNCTIVEPKLAIDNILQSELTVTDSASFIFSDCTVMDTSVVPVTPVAENLLNAKIFESKEDQECEFAECFFVANGESEDASSLVQQMEDLTMEDVEMEET